MDVNGWMVNRFHRRADLLEWLLLQLDAGKIPCAVFAACQLPASAGPHILGDDTQLLHHELLSLIAESNPDGTDFLESHFIIKEMSMRDTLASAILVHLTSMSSTLTCEVGGKT
jgi:hypothetical protein